VSRFAATLSQTSRRLNLPQHITSRVVLELAADLEDLFEHYTAQGLSEEEATERALEAAELSDEAVARLVEVHASPTGRLVERLEERTRTPWERLILLLIALFVVIGIGSEMLTGGFFSDASPFLWPVAAATATGFALVLWKIYGLFFVSDPDPRRLRSGLPSLLGLAALSILLALFGVLVEMHQAALSVENTALSLAEQSLLCIARIAPLIVFSLTSAVVLAVAWFALSSRVGRMEESQASILLDGGSS
jgi:hypothetical protein